MNLFRIAVKRPVATAMLFVAIVVFGVFSYLRLPVDLFPDMEPPTLSVITTYTGAGALEVEQNITDPLESQLSTVPDLDEFTSASVDGASMITMEFDWNADMDEATNEVRDALDRASPLLPDDAQAPVIQKFDAGAIPVVIFSATADESYYQLDQIIDDHLAGPLNRLPGVGDVSITGAPQLQIDVTLDPDRLENYHLDVEQISQTLQAENIRSPAGALTLGDDSYNLRVNTEFDSIDQIGDVIVASRASRKVRLREVAHVSKGLADETTISRVDGRQSVTFSVQKQSDANTVEVAEQIRTHMPQLTADLPSDVEVELLLDTSDFIVNSIDNLSSVLFYALLFVVVVVLLFLRQWRATLIVAATIPVSLIVAFIYLSLTGSTLNIISLSSLSIALGMVVDDAIVVLENIMRHVENGSPPEEAAVYGTGEVGLAVMATTLTVVAVFLPLTLLSGMTGVWFAELGLIVVVTVVTSTLAALTLIPMMASLLLRRRDEGRRPPWLLRVVSSGMGSGLGAVEKTYGGALRTALRFKKTVVFFALLLFGAGLLVVPSIGTEFMSLSDNNQIRVTGELETSRSLEYTSDVVEHLEKSITEEVPEVAMLNATIGGGGMRMMAGVGRSNEFRLRIELVDLDERDRSVFDVAEHLREILGEVPELVTYSAHAGTGADGDDEDPIAVHIMGHDLDETTLLAEDLRQYMLDIEGLRDVNISRGKSRPEFEFVPDRDRLSHFDLNSAALANLIHGNVAGQTATQYRRDGDKYDVVVRFPEDRRNSLRAIENMSLLTPSGHRVRVGELGEIVEYQAPPNIEHRDRSRVVTVSADHQDRPLNHVISDIQHWLHDQHLPPHIDIEIAGDFQQQQETFDEMAMILVLVIILVYLVMASQFGTLREPFVIMFSIPFAFTGVLLASLLTETPIGVMSALGAIILVGIVVKNAIVLVDYIKLLRNRGHCPTDAIVDGGIARLRPVLMTTLTTVLAMMPLALNLGQGAEIWQPMAISVIGGLLFSTLVTLVLVPVIYGLVDRQDTSEEGL